VTRIICALFVAAALTMSVSVPTAAARSCYAEWEGQGSFVACDEPAMHVAGAPWTWAFVAGWTSIVALLLLADRCARRREREEDLDGDLSAFRGSSRQAS
jgi:membrane protein implicated in regulation of membrane protease activity